MLPFPSLGDASHVVPLAFVAVAMAGVEVYLLTALLPRDGAPVSVTRLIIALSSLVGSGLFLVSLLAAVLYPWSYTAGIGILLAMNFMMFVPVGLWMIGTIVYRDRPIHATSRVWPVVIGATVVGSEVLMSILFSVEIGAATVRLPDLESAFTSPWLYWPMAAVMAALLVWTRPPAREGRAIGALIAVTAVAPWLTVAPAWAGGAMAAVMAFGFIDLFEGLVRRPVVPPGDLRFAIGVGTAYLLMAVGELALVASPSTGVGPAVFGGTMLAVMLGEVTWIVARVYHGTADEPAVVWTREAGRMTTFLGAGFVAEWAMAAAIGIAWFGPGFLPAFGPGWIGGAAGVVAVIGTVTASPIFLAIMGAEMGALVLRRIGRTVQKEQRARLALALGAFATYTVGGPAFVPGWPSVPGAWPNIGAFGPVAGGLVLPMVVSYLGVAIAVALFGRRAYCSVLCPSAVMYGGGFTQALIPTIREAPAARHHALGSRWRGVARFLAVSAWVSFGIVAVTSAAIGLGWVRGLPGGFDPAVLYSWAVWNVAWYAFFLAIPYVGMSACRTWGFCSTGTLYGLVGYFGLYRKEALDPAVCRACRTHDCGKACEVGLVDMPVALARTGRYRSIKCVGAHDCDLACPYGNLVSRDVRDHVRRILGLPDRHRSPGTANRPAATRQSGRRPPVPAASGAAED